MMKRTTKLRLLALGLGITVVAAVLVTAELLLRYSILSSSQERRDHVEERAYMPIKFRGNYQGTFWKVPFKTNRFGFRDEPDFGLKPSPNEFRVLALGDSIGFGLGIAASDHYTKVLERRLNEDPRNPGRKFHVVNASGQGYGPSGYYVWLRNEATELEFDMIIVDAEMCTVVTNEAMVNWVEDPKRPHRAAKLVGGRYVVGWDGNMLATCAIGGYCFEKTYLYTDLLRRTLNLLQRISPQEPFKSEGPKGVTYYHLGFDRYVLDEERLASGWYKAFNSLQGLRDICTERGVPFMLLVFPSRYMFDEPQPWRSYATDLMDRGLTQARESGLPFIDLTEPVAKGGGKDLYYDFAHMTAEGNHVVGEAMYQHLADQMLKAAAQPEENGTATRKTSDLSTN